MQGLGVMEMEPYLISTSQRNPHQLGVPRTAMFHIQQTLVSWHRVIISRLHIYKAIAARSLREMAIVYKTVCLVHHPCLPLLTPKAVGRFE